MILPWTTDCGKHLRGSEVATGSKGSSSGNPEVGQAIGKKDRKQQQGLRLGRLWLLGHRVLRLESGVVGGPDHWESGTDWVVDQKTACLS